MSTLVEVQKLLRFSTISTLCSARWEETLRTEIFLGRDSGHVGIPLCLIPPAPFLFWKACCIDTNRCKFVASWVKGSGTSEYIGLFKQYIHKNVHMSLSYVQLLFLFCLCTTNLPISCAPACPMLNSAKATPATVIANPTFKDQTSENHLEAFEWMQNNP